MNLKLENIGIVKKADIKIDGLTVIAGENDSGKSTIGKVLYSIIKSISKDGKVSSMNMGMNFAKYFEMQISEKGNILLEKDDTKLNIDIVNNKVKINNKDEIETCFLIVENANPTTIMIETPLIWNMMSLFTKLPLIEEDMDVNLEYPMIMKDLHRNLSIKSRKVGIDISNKIQDVINGKFIKNNLDTFIFEKKDKQIKLINTATGIKYFGILQVLSQNNHLHNNQILILDEPEVHLHPKWQLKLAEVIIFLVKNSVKILVNSHSPYMIEALQKYSKKEQIEDKTNFYLAENGIIGKVENSNSRTLSEIFEKLSEPYDVFEQMESDRF